MKRETQTHKMTFATMQQSDVPRSRNGKHRRVVSSILADVETLSAGIALKVPLEALQDSKENLRSALSRESKKRNIEIATAADTQFLYVWRIQK